MRILISNDDGVDALGLSILAAEIAKNAEVTVVAPDSNKSASSASLTLQMPIRCQLNDNGFYSVSGTPCDCVHLGSHKIMQDKPDMVIAGINHGANLGDDVIYSGTVAAAMEGRSLGFPAIAVSLASRASEHYLTAAKITAKLLQSIKINSLDSNIVLNVNVPDLPEDEIKGIKVTRLGARHRSDTIIEASDPKGETIYWLGPPSEPQDIGDGTDFCAIEQGFVSITPIVVDLTAHQRLNQVESWLNDFL